MSNDSKFVFTLTDKEKRKKERSEKKKSDVTEKRARKTKSKEIHENLIDDDVLLFKDSPVGG